jgi:uncharacterized protein YegP (UPF0339 family)
MVDADGSTIALSKGHFPKQARLSGIAALKDQVPDAEIEDRTVFPAEK